MKKLKAFIFLIIPFIASSQTITHPCGNEKIQYLGRFDKSFPTEFLSAYPGSEIRFTFSGKKLSVKLVQINNEWSSAWFDVRIDGKLTDSLKVNDGNKYWHKLFESSIIETHTISLFRRNEPWAGEVSFPGIQLEGELIDSPLLPQNKILFAGASWESGYGNLADYSFEESQKVAYSDEKTNNYYAFPAIVSRELNTQYTCVCYGGKGLTRDFNGDTTNQLPALLYKSLPIYDLPFDMQSFVPEIIVLDLGGNDFVKGIPDKGNYVSKYVETIESLRSLYPHSHIILSHIILDSGIINQNHPYLLAETDYINTVYSMVKSKGETKFHLWRYEEGNIKRWGQNTHPNVITYVKIARSLTDFIKSETDYNPTGLPAYEKQNKVIKIYPNPVKDELNIYNNNGTFEVLDFQGNKIMYGSGNKIDTSKLENGFYFLKAGNSRIGFIKQ